MPGARCVFAPNAIEHARQELFGDSLSCVGDLKLKVTAHATQ